METRANYILIGAFTLAGLVGIVALFVWFARVELDQQYAYYDVRFSSVSGLSEASDVRFSGLPVGQVVDVRLSPSRDGTITVRLEVDADTPVRVNSLATIESQGVTGVSFVGIGAGDLREPLIERGAGDAVPELQAGQSAIQALTEDAPQLLSEALGVVREVRDLLGSENQARVEAILQNAETASESLASTLETFSTVPATLDRFAVQVEAFNSLLAGISPEVEALLTTAETTVGSLGSLSQRAETMIVTANDTLAIAQGTFNDTQRYIAEDLTATTDALRQTLTQLQGEIDVISRDARGMMATFTTTGTAANSRLAEAETTLAAVNDVLAQIGQTAGTVDGAVTRFDTLLETEGVPLMAQARAAMADATAAINVIGAAAQTDLPAIVADIREATQTATQTITQLATDLTAASGRVDELSVTAQTALTQVTTTFSDANTTLEAITRAMDTGERALAVAETTFTGADRVINEDISGIITGLEGSISALNTAIAQVSADIPGVTSDLRAAGQSAADAFATLQRTVTTAGPPIADFANIGLPLYTRLADEARGLVDNLDRLTQQIQRDPARFFLNQQSPEFQR